MQFIGGKFQDGKGEDLIVVDKYTGDKIKKLKLASDKQIKNVVELAFNAKSKMSELSSGERKEILLEIRNGVEKRKGELAETIRREAGKPVDYAKTEVERALETIGLAAEEAIRYDGEKLNLDYGKAKGKTAYTTYMPKGVVAGITPFNFPLNLMMHKVAPAIATGNSIIIKPASYTPLTALMLAEIIDTTALPKGAFNVVLASGSQMKPITQSEKVDKITFTGSDEVGWSLKKNSGKKHITLELGGNAPVLVDDTVNEDKLQKIASEVAYGSVLYAGQICISTQRIIVTKGIYNRFKKLLVNAFEEQRYGDTSDSKNVCGPLISEDDFSRVSDIIKDAQRNGANVLTEYKEDKKHNIISPTLLENVPENHTLYKDELFGPAAILEKASDFENAIAKANDTRYGLQVGVFTDSLTNMKTAQSQLRYGGIIFNSIPGFRMDAMPYGGVGDSGFGREGVRYAMESMVEKKLIVF